jgi:hypothetical protein
MYLCMYAIVYVCMLHMYVCVSMCVCTRVRTHIDLFIHTHTHTRIYTGADFEPVSERLHHSQTGKLSRKSATQ